MTTDRRAQACPDCGSHIDRNPGFPSGALHATGTSIPGQHGHGGALGVWPRRPRTVSPGAFTSRFGRDRLEVEAGLSAICSPGRWPHSSTFLPPPRRRARCC
jgi:hypothetical protein